jgi:hypothetical protein
VAYAAGSASDSLASPTAGVGLTSGQVMLFSFDAGFAQRGSVAAPYIYRNASPWDSVVSSSNTQVITGVRGTPGQRLTYEQYLRPSASANARVTVKTATGAGTVNVDNVSLRPVTGYSVADPRQWAAAIYPTGAGQYVDCDTLGWGAGCTTVNVDGTPVALPTTLPAGTSWLLLRTSSPFRR